MPQASRGARSTFPAFLKGVLAQETRVMRCEKTAHMLVTREKLF